MIRGLTSRQRNILTYIRLYIDAVGYPPCVREIADATDLRSTSSVTHQLRALQFKGYLRRDPKTPRGLALIERGQ